MSSMTVDEKTTWVDVLAAIWNRIASNRIVKLIIWARWIITVAGFAGTLLWYAYLEGQDISGTLSTDYESVQTAQASLLDDSLELQGELLNPKVTISLDEELAELRQRAMATIGALGGLRAPTGTIEQAQNDYRASLEQLIAITNRIERGETANLALPLHNGLQAVANSGGALRDTIGDFQGGMWPQLIGSIF